MANNSQKKAYIYGLAVVLLWSTVASAFKIALRSLDVIELLLIYLWLSALRLSDSTAKITSLIFLSPFLSLVFIYFLVGEEIKLTTILGLVIIIVGVFVQRGNRPRIFS